MLKVSPQLDIYHSDIGDIQILRKQWQTLEKSSDVSFFLSWYWIENWLALKPAETEIRKVTAYHDDKLVALAIFTKRNITRNYLFRSSVTQLHEYGISNIDMMIEHNGILSDKQYQDYAPGQILKYLVENINDWDEIQINAINKNNELINLELIKQLNLNILFKAASESRYVDLERLRTERIEYLSTLSRNTRYQIRRTIKKYEAFGSINIKIADSVSEAIQFFDELKALHQSYWNSKGESGSFANPTRIKFHHDLIKHATEEGGIQIIKISAGEKIIGYIYNFVKNGYVSMYQTGLNYEKDSSMKPGLLAHYLAIEHNIELGNKKYDFLAGNARYKKSLSGDSERLVWVIIQRKKLRFITERILKEIAKFILRTDKNIEF